MKFSGSLFTIVAMLWVANVQGQDSTINPLQTVIVTGSKMAQKRTELPVSIAVINAKEINFTKAPRIDFLLNKVAGVNMPSIGNEQHMMAIRQPISLKGLYLYLEDGLPIRTSGLFSNNALIEILSANINSIEIIKGPASAMYGAEAIGGVVNILSKPADTIFNFNIGYQTTSLGLQKIDMKSNIPKVYGTWQINASWAEQKRGPIDFSDYIKKGISIRHDFTWTKKLTGYQTLNVINYDAQMTGSVDSLHFFQKNFSSQQTFTFRKINALRFRQNFQYNWSNQSSTILNFMMRNNKMDQNPTYTIASTSNPTKFKGQTNSNEFNSYVLDFQHIWNLPNLNSKFMLGSYMDITNQNLIAHFINILKDTVFGKYTSFSYPTKDSLLTNYNTVILNKAMYLNYFAKFNNRLSANATIRYDVFDYTFNNQLNTGTPSAKNVFTNWTPKIGLTYNLQNIGGFINYSEGFVPPQITEIYNAVRVPYLLPQKFYNNEIGFWFAYKKWQGEITIYQLIGNNEIVSVRQPDGVNLNQNTGNTSHKGIEYQFKYQLTKNVLIGINATNAIHQYINTNIKGTDVSGNQMNAAPNYFGNTYLQWNINNKIAIQTEWMYQSAYFMDEINATKYAGYNLGNFRVNYKLKHSQIWLHALNFTNTYYSTMATKNFSVKGNAAYSFYIGEPRSIHIGYSWSIKP